MGESIYWVDHDGGCLKLYDSDDDPYWATYSVLDGVEAMHMPEFDFSADRSMALMVK